MRGYASICAEASTESECDRIEDVLALYEQPRWTDEPVARGFSGSVARIAWSVAGRIVCTSAMAPPGCSVEVEGKAGCTLPKSLPTPPRPSLPTTLWRSKQASRGRHHSSGDGQPQFAYAQGTHETIRREGWRLLWNRFTVQHKDELFLVTAEET